MKFPQILLAASLALTLAACGSNSPRPDSSSNTASATPAASTATTAGTTSSKGTIRVQLATPYAPDGMNDPAVQRECDIHIQLPGFIQSQAKTKGLNVELVPEVKSGDKGKNLLVSFVRTQSSGNAFTGHYKYTEIKAVLYEDGKQVADLIAARRSGGGAFGGYKGSCSVMGRTVRTLGDDVAQWLAHPVAGARAGNL